MDATWPTSTLPRPASSMSGTTGAGSIVTEMDTGRKRIRRRTGNESQELTLTWLFTDLQFRLFRIFFRDTLQSGSQWFTIDLADGSGAENLTPTRVRFIDGQYRHSYVPHMQYQVSAQVERDVVETVDEALILEIYAYAGDPTQFFADLTDLNTLINTTLPSYQ